MKISTKLVVGILATTLLSTPQASATAAANEVAAEATAAVNAAQATANKLIDSMKAIALEPVYQASVVVVNNSMKEAEVADAALSAIEAGAKIAGRGLMVGTQKSSKAQKSLKTMRPTAVKATVVKAGKTAKAKSTKSPASSVVTQPGPTLGAVATASPSGSTNTCVLVSNACIQDSDCCQYVNSNGLVAICNQGKCLLNALATGSPTEVSTKNPTANNDAKKPTAGPTPGAVVTASPSGSTNTCVLVSNACIQDSDCCQYVNSNGLVTICNQGKCLLVSTDSPTALLLPITSEIIVRLRPLLPPVPSMV
jgi:hypothetical protein